MLRDYPSGSYSIPYHLTQSEIQAFLARHAGEPALSTYLYTKDPPYGMIVTESYGQLLVWFDASGILHVVDVTNLTIARQVQQAPFESPDSGFFENLQHSFDDLFGAVSVGLGTLAVIALGYLAWRIKR